MTAIKEVDYANEVELDIIVVDHHASLKQNCQTHAQLLIQIE